MDVNRVAGLLSGFVASLVMTALIATARTTAMTRMPSFELLTGSMMSGNPGVAEPGALASTIW